MKRSANCALGCGRRHELAGWLAVCLTVVFASGHASAEIFRCTINGQVVYSDHPCGSASTKIDIEPLPQAKTTEGQRLQYEADLGRIAVGMTPGQVTQAWGRPVEISSEQDGMGSIERWTFNRAGEVVTVQIQGGKVSKITKVKSLAPSAAAPPTGSAGQLTIGEMEERERLDKAGERRFARAGMTQEEARGRFGSPSDRRITTTRFGIADCWTYLPAPRDPQTLTYLCFSADDTRLVTIDRTVQR